MFQLSSHFYFTICSKFHLYAPSKYVLTFCTIQFHKTFELSVVHTSKMVSSETDDVDAVVGHCPPVSDNSVRTDESKSGESDVDVIAGSSDDEKVKDQLLGVDPFCHKIEMPQWMW